MIHPKANRQFKEFMANFPGEIVYFPQLPEDNYDLTHPNFRGRADRSQTVLDWLNGIPTGDMPTITWPLPNYHDLDRIFQ